MSTASKNVKIILRDTFHELRFIRPEAMNTLSLEMIKDFDQALADIATMNPRCVLLTAEGKNFMAGGDLGYLKAAGNNAPHEARTVIKALNRLFIRLIEFPCPTVIATQGAIAGAGISLTLACDWVISANNSRFIFAYDQIAASPDGGLTWLLPRAIGIKQAIHLMLSTDPVTASEAERLGIIAETVEDDELTKAAEQVANRIAKGATLAYSATRKLFLNSYDRDFPTQLDAELDSFCALAGTRDFKEAITAFFERKKPEFHGR